MNQGFEMGKPYLDRVIDLRLSELLRFNGAVLIEGPRNCGKTMTALHSSNSSEFLDSEHARNIAEAHEHLGSATAAGIQRGYYRHGHDAPTW